MLAAKLFMPETMVDGEHMKIKMIKVFFQRVHIPVQ
jgi:hypothetical protein